MRMMTCVLMGAMVLGLSTAGDTELVPVGLQKQLFVDDYIIAEKHNVTRQLGKVKKHGIVLEPTLPTDFIPPRGQRGSGHYERALKSGRKPDGSRVALDFGFYTTVLWNEKDRKFQMWYMPWRMAGVGYAESKDGIHWTKPLVGESGRNNVIHLSQSFSCSIDPTLPWDHPEKYKAAFDSNLDRVCQTGLAYSADGIHWSNYNNGKPVTHRAADCFDQIFWDPIMNKYRLICRTDIGGHGGAKEYRSARIMVHDKNNDLKKHPTAWKTIADKITVEDPKKEKNPWGNPRLQFNWLTNWIYEGIYFAPMNVYTMDRSDFFDGFDYQTRHEKDVLDFYIGTSRDGINFDKSWIYARKPLVPRGPAGSFDKDGVFPPSQFVTHKDEHWIFYGAASERHYSIGRDMKIGLAKLRLDGFICLQAKDTSGTVVTKTFKLEGDKLEVNVDAKDGWVQIELLDENRKAIPGLSGKAAKQYKGVNELRLKPQWKSGRDLSQLKDKTVRLRFNLQNARLYSFGFKKMRDANASPFGGGKSRKELKPEDFALKAETVQAGFFTPARTGKIWDTWIYYLEGKYYMYYLAGSGGHWDGHELATSEDGVHWKEKGVMIKPRAGVTWMGTGHIWKSPDFARNHQWVMNYSEWFGDKQDIMFATSTDLLNWTKVDEKHRFVQDVRWYKAKGRWDCIDTIRRDDGSLYGYFTANPDVKKVTYRPCGFGFAESRDGITWEALPPVEGDISGEFGGIQKLGDKFYILISEGRIAVGDKPEGPFLAQKKNPNAFGKGCNIYFPRFFHNAPGGPLVNHFYTGGTVFAAPLKDIEVDREGTLRLKWWKNNDKLKAEPVETGLVEAGEAYASSLRMLDKKLDLSRTNVIEGTVGELPLRTTDSGKYGIFFDHGDGHGQCLLLARDAVKFGKIKADGSDLKIQQTTSRDMDFGPTVTFRLVIKLDMLELYINNYLMNLKRVKCNGRVGFTGAGDEGTFRNIKVWQSN